jgi:type I restriction enzyme S subunit
LSDNYWKTVKIKELGKVVSGGTPKTSISSFWDGDVLWATPTDITKLTTKKIYATSRNISTEGLKNSSAKLLPKGSLLICTRATIGQMAIAACDISTNQGFKNIIPNKSIDIDFLYYLLHTKKQEFLTKASGSTFLEISKTILENIKLNIPNILEQKKIANVLSVLDDKIELNNRINAELEAMAKTLYDYWFVQFDFPDANGKPYKSSGGKMVYNETLKREIPEGWESVVIENILDTSPKNIKIQKAEVLHYGSVPVIDQGKDFICGFTNNKQAFISPIKPHIIFGDHTRTVKLVNFNYARGADGTKVLISNNKCIPGYLMYQIILSIDLSNYGYARHFKFLKDYKIILPAESVAKNYNDLVSPLFNRIKQSYSENLILKTLRDWLLPMLMNGQVKVK